MQLTLDQYSHDLKRNISALLAGTTILVRKTPVNETDKQNVLKEMSQQCEATLEMLERLFDQLQNQTKREEK